MINLVFFIFIYLKKVLVTTFFIYLFRLNKWSNAPQSFLNDALGV